MGSNQPAGTILVWHDRELQSMTPRDPGSMISEVALVRGIGARFFFKPSSAGFDVYDVSRAGVYQDFNKHPIQPLRSIATEDACFMWALHRGQ